MPVDTKNPRKMRGFLLFSKRLFGLKILDNVVNEKEQMFFGCRIKLVDIFNALHYFFVVRGNLTFPRSGKFAPS